MAASIQQAHAICADVHGSCFCALYRAEIACEWMEKLSNHNLSSGDERARITRAALAARPVPRKDQY